VNAAADSDICPESNRGSGLAHIGRIREVPRDANSSFSVIPSKTFQSIDRPRVELGGHPGKTRRLGQSLQGFCWFQRTSGIGVVRRGQTRLSRGRLHSDWRSGNEIDDFLHVRGQAPSTGGLKEQGIGQRSWMLLSHITGGA
jgi:hypothetical protein